MSLQARAINNENAGVPRAQNLKPGEAPSKQSGLVKRKGLSEMSGNTQLGARGLSAAPKVAVRTFDQLHCTFLKSQACDLNCLISYSGD